MSNVRGLRDPRKRWLMQFDLQLEEGRILPVLLLYEPGLREQLEQLRQLFADEGALDVSAWWEQSESHAAEITIGLVLTRPESDQSLVDMLIHLPQAEWEGARQRAAAVGRHTVLLSITANPAVLTLQDDPTSWEAEVPLAAGQILQQRQDPAEWGE